MGGHRFYCRKYRNGSIKLPNENILKMMKDFVYRVKENRKITLNFINKQIKKNKNISLWSLNKGNTVLQYYGLNKDHFIRLRSPFKWEKYTIGTGIKIISEKS